MSLSYSNALIVANGKKPHTALVLSDNEVIDTVAAERCPETGLEPATHRLLVECSTIELLERKRKKAAEGDRFF